MNEWASATSQVEFLFLNALYYANKIYLVRSYVCVTITRFLYHYYCYYYLTHRIFFLRSISVSVAHCSANSINEWKFGQSDMRLANDSFGIDWIGSHTCVMYDLRCWLFVNSNATSSVDTRAKQWLNYSEFQLNSAIQIACLPDSHTQPYGTLQRKVSKLSQVHFTKWFSVCWHLFFFVGQSNAKKFQLQGINWLQ